MSKSKAGVTGVQTQIRHVREALKREFHELLDMSDVTSTDEREREQAFLSRALAALVVRDLTGCDSKAAAEAVIDGQDDIGIDAIAIDDAATHLWLIQSKWSDTGKAGFGVAEALKFVDGLRHIDQRKFDRFNTRFQSLADQVDAVLANRRSQVTMVAALMRTDDLSQDVKNKILDAQDEFNAYGAMLDHKTYRASDIWQIVRNDFAEPAIPLTAKLERWIKVTEPYEAFHGMISAAEVAQWYAEHGNLLFERNIRKPLGLTNVNLGLVETLTQDAHNFWYFNNGITILCHELEPNYFALGRQAPVTLHLSGASVVNGAQTVAAIHAASQQDPEAVAGGYVSVRVISLKHCPPGFAGAVTTATNTQNRVERRDFVALDAVQAAIKEDFMLSLQKSYVVKRGELDPPPDSGCSVVHAATALACAHPNVELAVRARQDPDLLWESGPQGAYELLFGGGNQPTAHQIWHSVLILRAVGEALHQTASKREGRAQAIAQRGNLLITHLVFQHLDLDDIDDPDADWKPVLAEVRQTVERVTAWLVHHVDAEFGTGSLVASTLANPDRCRTLVDRVLADVRADQKVPDLPPEYRPVRRVPKQRRPNAVPTLINAGRIPDGTTLVYQAPTEPERLAMAQWLAEDSRRGQASWVNERGKPVLWAADGKRYSPSGLVQRMWRLAGWAKAPVAAQGPARWHVAGEGSLWELALTTLAEAEQG